MASSSARHHELAPTPDSVTYQADRLRTIHNARQHVVKFFEGLRVLLMLLHTFSTAAELFVPVPELKQMFQDL